MDSNFQKRILNNGTRIITVVSTLVVIVPMIVLRENYIFTVHDYLDIAPNLFKVLRESNLFWTIDDAMPVMNGNISTSYLPLDFGIYRLLNYLFGFIWGEIINKGLGILLGYFCMKNLLNEVFDSDKEKYRHIFCLLSTAYAISPVLPLWTISFSVLPILFAEFYRYIKKPEKISVRHSAVYLLFAFAVYFPCVGIFVLGVWLLGIIFSSFYSKKFNAKMMLSFVFMCASTVVFNINIFVYVLRGDSLNRTLKLNRNYYDSFTDGVVKWFTKTVSVGIKGQYHAAPCLTILLPLCAIGFIVLTIKAVRNRQRHIIRLPLLLALAMICFCMIYGANEIGLLSKIISKILPVFSGFNLGRIVYFNNVLWYLLAATLITACTRGDGKFCMIFIVIQIFVIIMSNRLYYDTKNNLFYARSISEGAVSYKEFFDEEYFSMLKEKIDYNGEGVISVGYHPAVTMYNGYNTLDGYFNVHPMSYHDAFRKVIEPMLEKYPALRDTYDTSGIRLYAYIDDSKDVTPRRRGILEAKELLINTEALEELGGKYVFSLYELLNAEDLNLKLVYHGNDKEGIYSTLYVYEIQ